MDEKKKEFNIFDLPTHPVFWLGLGTVFFGLLTLTAHNIIPQSPYWYLIDCMVLLACLIMYAYFQANGRYKLR